MKTQHIDNSKTQRPLGYREDSTILDLQILIAKLKQICQDIDPYTELSLSMKESLIDVGIEEFHDPFALTNQLLFMTENAIEKLAQLKEEI
ncbi:hypothetical protein [Halobacteriovorax sp. HLS]|uniref:hypothetical protein n=1 Tax=Halobacteriovorax sp. HLS TaxID=2234000 RepID=UPI000FDAE8C5|nr:hypothetical protein [Halobacteriovorax sp. HLS]